MIKPILHLSHTDISNDSRILKEIISLKSLNIKIFSFGVTLDELGTPKHKQSDLQICSFILLSRSFWLLPRPIKYLLNIIELTLRIVANAFPLRPSIVHCHDTLVLPAGLILKFFFKANLIYDAHELESNKNGQSKLLSICTLLIEKVCWPSIDLFISVSPSIIEWYMSKFCYKDNLLLLNSPSISNSRFQNIKSPHLRESYFHNLYNLKEDSIVFIYLGIFALGRGIDVILKSFGDPRLKNCNVVFIGYGHLEQTIKNYSIEHSNIYLHEPVVHDEVVNLVSSADCGICLIENISLSDYYSLPNKLFEYAFAGLDVLASDLPEISKVVYEYSLGQCCALEKSSFIDAALAISKKKVLLETSDLSKLSWETQSNNLVQSYKKLLSL